ncbi:hypothetical protein M513_04623 [Trichuris suis]|uniref:Uncharacterized protein n=1 Tax=Trichuris suis TaxID=68888 RepID=A0A085MB80_9BILA|nr:hypothetical protein M513_04623 [Trichuris suis]
MELSRTSTSFPYRLHSLFRQLSLEASRDSSLLEDDKLVVLYTSLSMIHGASFLTEVLPYIAYYSVEEYCFKENETVNFERSAAFKE